MRVRTKIGRLAGQIIDLPTHAAENALMSGTAERVPPEEGEEGFVPPTAAVEETDGEEEETKPSRKRKKAED